jgi:hypothetical protein
MGDGEQSKTWRYRMRRVFVLLFEVGSLFVLLVFRSFDREVNDPLGWTAYLAGFAMLNVFGLIPALGVGQLVGWLIDKRIARRVS